MTGIFFTCPDISILHSTKYTVSVQLLLIELMTLMILTFFPDFLKKIKMRVYSYQEYSYSILCGSPYTFARFGSLSNANPQPFWQYAA